MKKLHETDELMATLLAVIVTVITILFIANVAKCAPSGLTSFDRIQTNAINNKITIVPNNSIDLGTQVNNAVAQLNAMNPNFYGLGTIEITGPGIYTYTNTINLGADTMLKCDSGVTLQINGNTGTNAINIQSSGPESYLTYSGGVENCIIQSITQSTNRAAIEVWGVSGERIINDTFNNFELYYNIEFSTNGQFQSYNIVKNCLFYNAWWAVAFDSNGQAEVNDINFTCDNCFGGILFEAPTIADNKFNLLLSQYQSGRTAVEIGSSVTSFYSNYFSGYQDEDTTSGSTCFNNLSSTPYNIFGDFLCGGPNSGPITMIDSKQCTTVAKLPTSTDTPIGSRACVTDSTTLTPGTCVGGGTNTTYAIYSGTAWNCM